jgi:hypothetical protein
MLLKEHLLVATEKQLRTCVKIEVERLNVFRRG